jgi:hypothetical protein
MRSNTLFPADAAQYHPGSSRRIEALLLVKSMAPQDMRGCRSGVAGLKQRRDAGSPPVVFRRDQAFLGVLVDDLVNRGVDSPTGSLPLRPSFAPAPRTMRSSGSFHGSKPGTALSPGIQTCCDPARSRKRSWHSPIRPPFPGARQPILAEKSGSGITEPVRLRGTGSTAPDRAGYYAPPTIPWKPAWPGGPRLSCAMGVHRAGTGSRGTADSARIRDSGWPDVWRS